MTTNTISIFLILCNLLAFIMPSYWAINAPMPINSALLQIILKLYIIFGLVLMNIALMFKSFLIDSNALSLGAFNSYLWISTISPLSMIILIMLVIVSAFVLLNAVDYFTINESYFFIIIISLFQLTMFIFISSDNIVWSLASWDWLGLLSFLLINWWMHRLNAGLKAIVFNKIGDCIFLLTLGIVFMDFNYSSLFNSNSCISIDEPIILVLMFLMFMSSLDYPMHSLAMKLHCTEFSGSIDESASYCMDIISSALAIPTAIMLPSSAGHYPLLPLHSIAASASSLFSIALLCIFISKSAQMPFTSWLLSAMAAPTPISALLHSSTMVIAGVFLAIQFNQLVLLFLDSYNGMLIIFVGITAITLLYSTFSAFLFSDIKSIIAFSTISQLSYMFIGLLLFPLLSINHIIVHALFKSLLFILAGSLIHIEFNYQSIFRLRIASSLMKVSFGSALLLLAFSLSKEGIIYSAGITLTSSSTTIILLMGALITLCYSLRLYYVLFLNARANQHPLHCNAIQTTLFHNQSLGHSINTITSLRYSIIALVPAYYINSLIASSNAMNSYWFPRLPNNIPSTNYSYAFPVITISSISIDYIISNCYSLLSYSLFSAFNWHSDIIQYNTFNNIIQSFFRPTIIAIIIILFLVFYQFIQRLPSNNSMNYYNCPWVERHSVVNAAIPLYSYYSYVHAIGSIYSLHSNNHSCNYLSINQSLNGYALIQLLVLYSSLSSFIQPLMQYFIVLYSAMIFQCGIILIESLSIHGITMAGQSIQLINILHQHHYIQWGPKTYSKAATKGNARCISSATTTCNAVPGPATVSYSFSIYALSSLISSSIIILILA